MTDISKKKTVAKFEQVSETMPRLSAETPGSPAEPATPESGQSEVRSIRVRKLDQQTLWRVIEMLKSL